MCDVCKAMGVDYKIANGHHTKLTQSKLYRVYKDKVASVSLCYIHDIQLFLLGEKQFLMENKDFVKVIIARQNGQ